MNGYCGKILHVDLTQGTFYVEQPEEAFYRKYVGGSAIGAYYALKLIIPGIDAFEPSNVLVFSTSATTGAPISGASRFNVNAKSPLTGGLGDSQAGGFWGTELKYAGFDAIVLTGRSPKPCILWVHDGEYQLIDASEIWGKETGPAQSMVREIIKEPKARVALIGPAGEKLVRYACITNELRHYNGRNGMGAVMGSKNLKAIAVRGTNVPEFYNRAGIIQMAQEGAKKSLENSSCKSLKEHGTAGIVPSNQALGGLPTRNWTSGSFELSDNISGQTMTRLLLKKNEACWGCAVRCKRVVEASEPYKIDPIYGGPEYETIGALGSYLGIGDLPAIAKGAELCNRFGIDTISAGGTIAFAMECFENGMIGLKETENIDLKFGNAEALLSILEMISERKGIGDLLAEGAYRAAEKLGKNSVKYAICSKKQEFPAHMPKVKASLALAYALNPFGADHMSSNHDGSISVDMLSESIKSLGFSNTVAMKELNFEKVKLFSYTQKLYSALDSLDLCMFCFGINQLYGLNDIVKLLNLSTGWEVTFWEIMQLGERRINMFRIFNEREGFSEKDDMLPEREFEPLEGGASDGFKINMDEFIEARGQYYELMGWNRETGKPKSEKLNELGLKSLLA